MMESDNHCFVCDHKIASHEIFDPLKTPKKYHLCCECHVMNGGTPADWHPVCMSTYKNLKSS